jgi:acetamidase/formamidase
VIRHLDGKRYEVTTGISPDLMDGARVAVSDMVELLCRRFGYTAVDAYMLCSVCGDLRISSIVDVPNWVVSFYFPRLVLELPHDVSPGPQPIRARIGLGHLLKGGG